MENRQQVQKIWPSPGWIGTAHLHAKTVQTWLATFERSSRMAQDLGEISVPLVVQNCKVYWLNGKHQEAGLAQQSTLKVAESMGEDRSVGKGILIADAISGSNDHQVNYAAELCIMHHNNFINQQRLVNGLTFPSVVAEH